MSDQKNTDEGEEGEALPKLPRAPLIGKMSVPGMIRIAMFATMLYAVVMMRQPCSEGVGRFIGDFEETRDAAPLTIQERYPGYELLTAEEALKRWPDNPARDGGTDSGSGSDSGSDAKTAP